MPNSITALSKLEFRPPEPFLRRLVTRARSKLPSFNSQALCNFIFGLCKLQFDPGVDFMLDFFAACRARMPAFTPAGFASMIHSVARLGYWPGAAFMAAFEAEVTNRGLDSFSRGELWKLAHGLASLHHRPDDAFLAEYFRAFNAKAGSRVGVGVGGGPGKLTVKDVSLVLWSMAALDAGPQHAAALAALVDTSAALVARHQLEPQDDEYPSRSGGDAPAVLKYRQLVQAGLYLRALGDPALDAALDRLDAALTAAWRPPEERVGAAGGEGGGGRQGGQEQEQNEGGTGVPPSVTASPTPTFHGAVLELLEEHGVNPATGTLGNVFNLEILLTPLGQDKEEAEPPVVLLLEGRGHFFTNELNRKTGDSELRRRLVVQAAEAEGRFKAVGQVTIWEWRAAKGAAARLRLLRGRLRSLGIDPEGYIPAPRDDEAEAEAEAADGVGQVHHVAAELVGPPATKDEGRRTHPPPPHAVDVSVIPETPHEHDLGAAAPPPPPAAAAAAPPPPPPPAAAPADSGFRTNKGYGSHAQSQRRRGGKRRIVAAARRASIAAQGASGAGQRDGPAAAAAAGG